MGMDNINMSMLLLHTQIGSGPQPLHNFLSRCLETQSTNKPPNQSIEAGLCLFCSWGDCIISFVIISGKGTFSGGNILWMTIHPQHFWRITPRPTISKQFQICIHRWGFCFPYPPPQIIMALLRSLLRSQLFFILIPELPWMWMGYWIHCTQQPLQIPIRQQYSISLFVILFCKEVADFDGYTKKLTFRSPHTEIKWHGLPLGDKYPRDTPRCGFYNENPDCQPEGKVNVPITAFYRGLR